MGSKLGLAAAAAVFLVLGACGGGEGGSSGSDMTVHGLVNQLPESTGGEVTPLEDVEVRATVDRDGDGRIAADETVTVTTDAEGAYRIDVKVRAGDTVVLRYRADGSAPLFRTVRAGPNADVKMTVGLRALESLSRAQNGRLENESRELSIANLADGLSGSARVFNPVTDAAAFPGGFGDSDGNLLISGVFSAVELTDGSDDVHQLDDPAELRMKLPLDTWNVVVDVLPGNDRIDVPLYAFDEVLGTWVREGEGHLEDGSGRILAEADLSSVRDGSFAGVVYTAGVVQHFSYWNVDWPVEAHGCLTGRVLLENGNPAEGATVTVSGVTYNGSSTPITVGADGRFCVDVMRSETAADDVDQDGTPGETHRVKLRVAHGGKLYEGGVFDSPSSQGTCGDGDCDDVGDIALDPSAELQAAICSVSGRILDRHGVPAGGATIWGFDETVPDEVFTAMCGEYLQNCTFWAAADENGNYALSNVAIDGLLLTAWFTGAEGTVTFTRYGERRLDGCPTGAVDVRLDTGYDSYTLEVHVAGEVVSWDPNLPVTMLWVSDAAGEAKWGVMVEDGDPGFTGPVTYGDVPAGAVQYWPYEGEVPPLASGDTVEVWAIGVTTEGYDYWGTGTAVVP